MSEVPRCQSFWGHRFEARLSKLMPRDMHPEVAARVTSLVYEHVYHGDVCVRCGVVVNSPPLAASESGNVQGGSDAL